MIVVALLAWIITASASIGRHSRIHDWIARLAMLLEGVLLWAAITGGPTWGLALCVAACFVAVGLTDNIKGQNTVLATIQWIRRRDANPRAD